MTFVIVYVDDDMQPHVYGSFRSRDAAQKRADKMDADLDESRDVAGGGAGHVTVCRIQPKGDWDA